ncbi:50S ribosomal protein L16 [Candidatus Kaiserbacteria bacterium RIFCSPHIGHO2_01_FULL_50_13]|uniref:50S ribosomal protein L16 n=1 Tax=Candidatus Kaiserbacteria bacterium RIFCSPLOWO2_01_FULL_50_24 TaxID=1798507 RepID=A0A1F6EMF8_9BACT|nr:MAG: 50S ribosomal protein L16 [Candidatus Kaiserbacteria bacterium RIFCSPHIGHO2_01_FULL_50_13]OGG74839.1 MAG: 50S ribosomal protein L16 [Candidatus Kaiserbacteria bacterium RIFCSPLOWO2_01_FULL_50_24]OGG81651.1 MAG: 50S ribosomal protein L16 [Candidatus Kaiserbacteria bacterium RIFCSPLOWO2_02_FULL_51_13]
MLAPKRPKHRKWQTGRRGARRQSTPETRGITVAFGSFGLKAITQARLTSNQLESARRALTRAAGKSAKIWTRVFPDRPYTQKAAEVGMGSGKGDLAGYVVDVRPGRVLFEVDGSPEPIAREALRKAGTKLPLKAKVVARQ